MLGGVVSWIAGKWSEIASRWISFIAVVIDFGLVLGFWLNNSDRVSISGSPNWLIDVQKDWIPQLGVSFHFSLDGLSLVMAALTLFVGALGVLVSWKEIKQRVGFYHFNLLWLLAGILGVFFSLDMLLFYFFWEIMLIPMFFIIGIWGYENRRYASIKFFLFTQLSGLLMLLAILGLYFVHGQQTGDFTFDYFALIGTSVSKTLGFWLMCGFLIAFLVKLPALPFHSWLPDSYVQSPTAGSVIIAGLMTKTAAYGMLRFVLPFFPDAAHQIAPLVMLLGVAGILYGAKMAYGQTDLKRLIAFSSFSHMGFIVIGIFSFTTLAYQGTILEMIAHGISISALFIYAGAVRERVGSRDLDLMGGLGKQMRRMSGWTMVFVMATLGLPGLGNFIAEFLILAGVFQASVLWSVLASLGLISAMIYSLVMLQKVYHGKKSRKLDEERVQLLDFGAREVFVMASLTVAIVWLGFFPQTIVRTVQPVVDRIENQMEVGSIPNKEAPPMAGIKQKAGEITCCYPSVYTANYMTSKYSDAMIKRNEKGGRAW